MSHHDHRLLRAPERKANMLGWFSIALGVAELAMPERLGRLFGMPDSSAAIRLCGAREVASGIAILTSQRKAPFVWGRVAGDAMDLAALGRAAGHNRNAAWGLAAVAGVTLLDVACAQSLSVQEPPLRQPPPRDYGGRSGFPKSPAEMRGAARRPKKPETIAEAGRTVRSLSI
jgi:hypothetical protein